MNNLTSLLFDSIDEKNLSMEKSNMRGIDYIVNNTPIIIKDWKRAIGVNVVIQADRLREYNKKISQIIILTNRYSNPAKALGDRIDILVFTLKELNGSLEVLK